MGKTIKHFRNCPTCKKKILYSRIYEMKYAKNRNSKCESCRKRKYHPMRGLIGRDHPSFGKIRPEHSKRMTGKKNPMWNKRGKLSPHFGKRHSKKLLKKCVTLY